MSILTLCNNLVFLDYSCSEVLAGDSNFSSLSPDRKHPDRVTIMDDGLILAPCEDYIIAGCKCLHCFNQAVQFPVPVLHNNISRCLIDTSFSFPDRGWQFTNHSLIPFHTLPRGSVCMQLQYPAGGWRNISPLPEWGIPGPPDHFVREHPVHLQFAEVGIYPGHCYICYIP